MIKNKHLSLQEMFLLCMTVTCVLFGSSAGLESERKCYGSSYRLPLDYSPQIFRGKMFFTPRNGGPRRLVMENGQVKDPRMKTSGASAELTDLKNSDDGMFAVTFFDNTMLFDIVSLTILDCSDRDERHYGSMYEIYIPTLAEYLEFTPLHTVDESKVLWNRSDPQTNDGGRGRLIRNAYEIHLVTQTDNGHYTVRRKNNILLSRNKLTVEANNRHYEPEVGDQLIFDRRFNIPWTVTFIPEDQSGPKTVMEGGKRSEAPWSIRPFRGRIWIEDNGIEINPVDAEDSGLFEFRDPQGNLGMRVQVEVKREPVSTYVYVGAVVGIIAAVIFCCCCVRKCCCKKSSSKRDTTPAAPAVYYHDENQENQPTGPSYHAATPPTYSQAIQQRNPPVSSELATTFLGPSVPAAAPAPAPAPSLASDCLSSDSDPKFELKGASAPPLSSDSTFSDVYTSAKLNFL